MAIEITDNAVEEVRRMMQKEGVQAAGLRVGVKGGGCSGLSYNLTFESQSRTGDKVFQRENVKLFLRFEELYLFERNGSGLRQRTHGQGIRLHESQC